jgi:glycosyltransferase involved in cell wall biosynthesis
MIQTSVIIPSRNELFLAKTIDDVISKAAKDIEVIVILDGYWPNPILKDYPNLVLIHKTGPEGMRPAINDAARIARGKYLMKLDAHCMVDKGFDEKLAADCDENWVVIPRRYSLDPEKWEIAKTGKPPVDYHYLSYPYAKPEEIGMHGVPWIQRAKERLSIPIDDEMSSQGSGWFMHKDYFWKFDGLSCVGYGNFIMEFQEIGIRTWLSGGKVMVNKNTWYAHLHKGKTYGRGYYISQGKMVAGAVWCANYWMSNKWVKRIHDMEWLVEKFWPVPTWPENWKELRYNKETKEYN